jgi:hypothetical protein
MKRIVALAAAAVICSTAGSAGTAKTYAIHLEGFCDNYGVTITGIVATAQDAPSCSGQYGGGMLATVKGFGKTVVLALQDPINAPGVQYFLELSYPFAGAGTYKFYQTTNGVIFTDEADGTYDVEKDAQVKHDGKPISSAFQK